MTKREMLRSKPDGTVFKYVNRPDYRTIGKLHEDTPPRFKDARYSSRSIGLYKEVIVLWTPGEFNEYGEVGP